MAILISRALLKIKALIAIGILFLAVGVCFIILGRTAHKTLLRK